MENNVGIRDILEYHFFKSHACIISDEDINQALSQIDSLFQQRLAEKKEELERMLPDNDSIIETIEMNEPMIASILILTQVKQSINKVFDKPLPEK